MTALFQQTHFGLDLLANFEARFDAAVLSIENNNDMQNGGEDSGDVSIRPKVVRKEGIHDMNEYNEHSRLIDELHEAKVRIDTLLVRAAKLEQSNENLINEREALIRS